MTIRPVKLLGAVAVMALLFACGDLEEESRVGVSSRNGIGLEETPEEGAGIELCKATFLDDQVIDDFFGDYRFEVLEGDEFVLGGRIGRTKMVRETESGVHLFDFRGDHDAFISSCEGKYTTSVLGVFADVTVFEERGMETELCRLKKGDIAQIDGGWSQSLASSNYGGEDVYGVSLNGFKERCGGKGYGYILVKSLGTMNNYMPLLNVLAED